MVKADIRDLDVDTPPAEYAGDASQHAKLIFDQHGNGMPNRRCGESGSAILAEIGASSTGKAGVVVERWTWDRVKLEGSVANRTSKYIAHGGLKPIIGGVGQHCEHEYGSTKEKKLLEVRNIRIYFIPSQPAKTKYKGGDFENWVLPEIDRIGNSSGKRRVA